MLAAAYMVNAFPALSLQAYQRFLERWPDRPEAVLARADAAKVRAGLEQHLFPQLGADGAEGLALGVLHDEVQVLLAQGRFAVARATAARLLERRPRFVPAWNNTSQACMGEGRFGEAADVCRRVLALEPDNFHALSNLTRCLLLSGRADEARATAGRLKAVTSTASDVWVKKAEALSYLGDDQGVLEAWRAGRGAGLPASPLHAGLFLHLAAVALCRQGQEGEARRLWQDALRRAPDLELAAANLEDLRQPAGKRHAPWPFAFRYWLQQSALNALVARVDRAGSGRKADDRLAGEMHRYLEEHPEVGALVPALLDRGDPDGRLFAFRLAMIAKTPELLAALRDFALGQRGPDELRMEAAATASEVDLIPAGPIRMWMRGEWTELLMLGFEVHKDSEGGHSPEVEEAAVEAMDALHEGDASRAEQLFRQALDREPEARDLQLNLAETYRIQGRVDEVDEMVRRLFERHPDYFFARTYLAHMYTRRGEYDRAREMLQPLLSRKRLHLTELNALCCAEFDWALAQGHRDGARTWLDMLARVDPGNRNLPALRAKLERPSNWLRSLGL
jgi:tetratricopeptide (TPR) repeat protein